MYRRKTALLGQVMSLMRYSAVNQAVRKDWHTLYNMMKNMNIVASVPKVCISPIMFKMQTPK